MGEIIGIVVFCVLVIGAAAWLLNRPECEKDPREDQEQMEYLEAKGTSPDLSLLF